MAFTTGAAVLEDESATLITISGSGSGPLSDGGVDAETAQKTTLTSRATSATIIATFELSTDNGASANSSIALFRQNLNQGGTRDDPVPSANFLHTYIGSIPVPDSAGADTVIEVSLSGCPLDGDCRIYIGNEIGVTIKAGWTIETDAKSLNAEAQ